MSQFIMMVGLPGSGKSTLAKKLSRAEQAVILSSDEIRKELKGNVSDQSDPNLIFNHMNNRATTILSEGGNVIYDATNLNRRKRRHLVNHVMKADEKIVYYINEHISTVKYRNKDRGERTVEEYVINRMYKSLQIPIINEGWNRVIFTSGEDDNLMALDREQCEKILLYPTSHDELFQQLSSYINEFKDIFNLPHDSTYHSFSVSRHIYHTYMSIFERYQGEDKLLLLWAALFHDLGKAFCKSFKNYKGEETKYANFIGHEHVSAQLAAWELTRMGYDEQFVKDIVCLVQFHMIPMNANDKKMSETKKLLGEYLFEKLMILHEADIQAK